MNIYNERLNFMEACSNKDIREIKKILKSISLNNFDENGDTFLHFIFERETDIMEDFLFDEDTIVLATTLLVYCSNFTVYDKINNENKTAFSLACEFGNLSLIELLLPKINKETLNNIDKYGLTCLDYVLCCGHLDVLKLLLSIPEVNRNYETLLLLAYERGYSKIVKWLLTQIPDNDSAINKLFEYACIKGHLKTVKLLINRVNFDIINKYKDCTESLFYKICMNNHLDLAKYLSSHRNFNYWNDNDSWKFVDSIFSKNYDMTEWLLTILPENSINGDGIMDSILDEICNKVEKSQRVKFMKLLINNGRLNISDKNYYPNALWYVSDSNQIELLQLLLKTTPAIQSINSIYHGTTPVMIAFKKGHYGIVELLMSLPEFDWYQSDAFGKTLLDLFNNDFHIHYCKKLLSKCDIKKIYYLSDWNKTPLLNAIKTGQKLIVKELLIQPDINTNNDFVYDRNKPLTDEMIKDIVSKLRFYNDVSNNTKQQIIKIVIDYLIDPNYLRIRENIDWFRYIVLTTDEYLALRSDTETTNQYRFLNIATRLPFDLQMTLICRLSSTTRNNISSNLFNEGLQEFVKKLN